MYVSMIFFATGSKRELSPAFSSYIAGLVRYDQVNAGEIAHALRFTAPQTRNTFIWPARHQASSLSGTQYPPMGQRFRLKASVDASGFGPNVQIILRALKKYGMFLADNGRSKFSATEIPMTPDAPTAMSQKPEKFKYRNR